MTKYPESRGIIFSQSSWLERSRCVLANPARARGAKKNRIAAVYQRFFRCRTQYDDRFSPSPA